MDLDSHEEAILRLVSEAHNREILTILENAGRPLHVDGLAERIAARTVSADGSAGSEEELERVRISLHHDRLPKLADAGLVEYDREDNVVARRDRPAVDAEWTDFDDVEQLLDRFHTGSGADGATVGTIEGREAVIEHGRRLADEAEEELFLMYVSTDLLEAECIRYARDAMERGVDIYLGSNNSSVRDLTRERLPEVTIWEPQSDWLNAPSSYPTVGRLVLADREKVMLALLDDPDSDSNAETAMIGEGEDNPLVALVRDLLGPRLDHLDYQSEDFRSQLPF